MRILIAFFAAIIVLSANAVLGAAPAGDIADRVQKRYESIKAFHAGFTQEQTHAASGKLTRRQGRIWFQQPSLVRWEAKDPEELIVVGPQAVWEYLPADKVAIRHTAAQLFTSKSMFRFLSGRANLKQDFKVQEQGSENGLIKIRLVPIEPETGMVLAYLWVDPKTSLLRQILVVDFYGNGNQVTLQGLVLDRKLDQKLFQFAPPPGVEIQDNTRQ